MPHPSPSDSPPSGAALPAPDPAPPPSAFRRLRQDLLRNAGVTLVELMVAITILVVAMLGFIGSFLQSRRTTEGSVLHAAATSLVYGLVEQVKSMAYTSQLPNPAPAPNKPDGSAPDHVDLPYILIRVNQDTVATVYVVYTQAPAYPAAATPAAPPVTPDPSLPANGEMDPKTGKPLAGGWKINAIDNYLGSLPLSTVTGSASQDLALDLWVWIDEIPNQDSDAPYIKKVTVVYTYSYRDGPSLTTVRDREVFLRTPYDI